MKEPCPLYEKDFCKMCYYARKALPSKYYCVKEREVEEK